jgi:hypothetical protein
MPFLSYTNVTVDYRYWCSFGYDHWDSLFMALQHQ